MSFKENDFKFQTRFKMSFKKKFQVSNEVQVLENPKNRTSVQNVQISSFSFEVSDFKFMRVLCGVLD